MWPTAVSLGPIYLSSFGIFLALGFIVSAFFLFRAVKNDLLLTPEVVFDAQLLTALGALTIGRLSYILLHPEEFADAYILYVLFRERPGLTFAGSFLGATLALILFTRLQKISLWRMLDVATWPYLTAYLFGQIGSFFDGFSFGTPTNLPWGVSLYGSNIRVHPLPLYQIVVTLTIMLFLRLTNVSGKKRSGGEGTTFLLSAGVLALFSALLDLRRGDMTIVANLPFEQTASLIIGVFLLILAYLRLRSPRQDIKLALAFALKIGQNIVRKH